MLHDLYHIKPDGIMTIVLPHGVLFRGGDEGTIRKNLIERNHIDAIIGLPANIFFGTGIPTIIMVLKQKRDNTDVLIIDASKGFEKVGKNNRLRACDIKKITDAVSARTDVPRFARVVSRDEIRQNDFNLNIPRYVDASEKPESWDIYAAMFGGIPQKEMDELAAFWQAFPHLRDALFVSGDGGYFTLRTADIAGVVKASADVADFYRQYEAAFDGFEDHLSQALLSDWARVNLSGAETALSAEVFDRLAPVPLVDRYAAYQLLHDEWSNIAVDLEILQTEGFAAAKQVDPNMVVKKKNGKDVESQDGWVGHVLPFELVQKAFFADALSALRRDEDRLSEIASQFEEMIDNLPEDEKTKLLNDDNDAFVAKEVKNALNLILVDVSTPETDILEDYLTLRKKNEKLMFIDSHQEIKWTDMKPNKDGTYGKKAINEYILQVKKNYEFDNDSYESIIVCAYNLLDEQKELNKQIKAETEQLHLDTKDKIEALTDDEVMGLLRDKWVLPLSRGMMTLPDGVIGDFVSWLEALAKKYDVTFSDIEKDIAETEASLSAMLGDLRGSEADMLGIAELKKMLGGA